ncbi:hypothetical protein AB1K56_03280 [Microbacterium sp. BWR-S6Y]|uniref:hypothetical protein n=1 Tax=Microbacterium sp. BWR-S6Y TaxID=3232073 RepID=UPI00352726BA
MNRAPAIAALGVTAVLLMTACAPESAPEGANVSATPTLSATPEFEVGAVVDAATAEALNSDSKGQYRGYPMPDGSYIVVDRGAPLPEPVQQDINSKGASHAATYTVDDGTSTFLREREKIIAQVGSDTGKRVVALLRMTGYDFDENLVTSYFFNGPFQPGVSYGSLAEAKASLDAWLSTQVAPNDFVVIFPE